MRLSARKGILRIVGKGEKVREIPIHPDLRAALTGWLDERSDWPGADTPALFLNQRGGRLSVKGAHDIITAIATAAGLEDEDVTAHVLRHTFATRLVRGRTDLVIVAELLGHARLETTRAYSRPTRQDAIDALELLTSTTEARRGPLPRRRRPRRSSTPQALTEDYRPVRLRAAGLLAVSGVSWLYPSLG